MDWLVWKVALDATAESDRVVHQTSNRGQAALMRGMAMMRQRMLAIQKVHFPIRRHFGERFVGEAIFERVVFGVG